MISESLNPSRFIGQWTIPDLTLCSSLKKLGFVDRQLSTAGVFSVADLNLELLIIFCLFFGEFDTTWALRKKKTKKDHSLWFSSWVSACGAFNIVMGVPQIIQAIDDSPRIRMILGYFVRKTSMKHLEVPWNPMEITIFIHFCHKIAIKSHFFAGKSPSGQLDSSQDGVFVTLDIAARRFTLHLGWWKNLWTSSGKSGLTIVNGLWLYIYII